MVGCDATGQSAPHKVRVRPALTDRRSLPRPLRPQQPAGLPGIAQSLREWVGFRSRLHHQFQKNQPLSVGFFRLLFPVLARYPGMASRAPLLQNSRFLPHRRLSVLRFLWWSRERSRGHFLCWRGFRGGRLWLASPVAVATERHAVTKKLPQQAGDAARHEIRAQIH